METTAEAYWTLNGEKFPLAEDTLSFEDICERVYGKRGLLPTIVYMHAAQEKVEGILHPGQSVRLGPKTYISCVFTNCA